MSDIRIRARSCIADPELARAATVDLPTAVTWRRPHAPRAVVETLVEALAAVRSQSEPERVIVLSLAAVPVRARR
ncbi:MAG TPA: hypothetical protein VFI69_08420 [Candidatus Limnocylindrales bacterium]|jgi:hypothetical protein|nr:hypothetical protein [Candidatus Limnocylindrales bacterium]